MDAFKLANFRKSHPGASPPEFHTLSESEALAVRNVLTRRLSLEQDVSPERLVACLDERETEILRVNATSDDFVLASVLQQEKIVPSEVVLLNWYRFDDIDRVKWADLSAFFHDIWYPSSDDVDLFDESCDWVVSVSHSGTVKALHLEK